MVNKLNFLGRRDPLLAGGFTRGTGSTRVDDAAVCVSVAKAMAAASLAASRRALACASLDVSTVGTACVSLENWRMRVPYRVVARSRSPSVLSECIRSFASACQSEMQNSKRRTRSSNPGRSPSKTGMATYLVLVLEAYWRGVLQSVC